MTDLLTPEEVREMLAQSVAADKPMACRLCRDYLTLWDRYKQVLAAIDEAGITVGFPWEENHD